MSLQPIHPFPARMAPEIAQRALDSLGSSSRVIDPMCGSGTVLRAAVERGVSCTGVDLDPLSVLMSRVWTTCWDTLRLAHDARQVVEAARSLDRRKLIEFPDNETHEFVAFWFAAEQLSRLRRLATVVASTHLETRDPLALCVSRVIITKERGASLARDTSHSRPHRVRSRNDYDVYAGFLRAAREIAARVHIKSVLGKAEVFEGDARRLTWIPDDAFNLALTSPPYLNAIDYMRGHRLALVWLGHDLAALREVRASSVGAERVLSSERGPCVTPFIKEGLNSSLGDRQRGWVRRYAGDLREVLRELQRVVCPGGRIILVVGNSFLRGAIIDNAGLIVDIAEGLGLRLAGRVEREIPARRRYLPPPNQGDSSLSTRMRTEVLLTLDVDG